MTDHRAAFAATSAALAALDPTETERKLAAVEAAKTEIQAGLVRGQADIAAVNEAIDLRERGTTEQVDQWKASEALLKGDDVVEAIESIETLEARKKAIAAGMQGLRGRLDSLSTRRISARDDLRSSLGQAIEPIADALVARAREAVAMLAAVYADAAGAAGCGSNATLGSLLEAIGEPLGSLARHHIGLYDGGSLTPSADLLAALEPGQAAMALLGCGPRTTVAMPHPAPRHNPYLIPTLVALGREAGERDTEAA